MVAAQTEQLYTHAAEPKSVYQRKAKYREDDASNYGMPANIMFDRRVVRGNTYAAQILPAEPLLEETKPRTRKPPPRMRPRTPDAVEGRRHMDVQTDQYLEELTDTVPETENATQTDAFMDRPPTPLFVPAKTGLDAVTQIGPGDLFDFDFEVEPILEVLVGKTLEQGLMEVMEEEELAAMRAHQEHFEQLRNAELVATQRMEAAEKRKVEEKERRLAQERERLKREKTVREKVAASTFARGYLTGMVDTVIDRLYDIGHFYDPVEMEVRNEFMPWLRGEAVAHLTQRTVVSTLLRKLAETAVDEHKRSIEAAARKASDAAAAAANHASKLAAARATAERAELDEVRARASYILHEMQPRIASVESVEEARTELETAAAEAATAAWEDAKQKASDEARAAAEAELAAKEEAAAAAAAEAGEEGGEGDAGEGEDEEESGPTPDEAAEAAAAAVPEVPPKEVTDGDVLSAMIDSGAVTKDAITHAMAVALMGDAGYIADPAFESERDGPPAE